MRHTDGIPINLQSRPKDPNVGHFSCGLNRKDAAGSHRCLRTPHSSLESDTHTHKRLTDRQTHTLTKWQRSMTNSFSGLAHCNYKHHRNDERRHAVRRRVGEGGRDISVFAQLKRCLVRINKELLYQHDTSVSSQKCKQV